MSRLTKRFLAFYWLSSPSLAFTQGQAQTVNLRSAGLYDPQKRVKTLSLASGTLPAGCSISGTSVVYDGVGAAASSSFTLTASDGTTTNTSSGGTATVQATQANQPPAWTVPENYQLPGFTTAGGMVDLTQYANDPEGDPMVFSRTGGTAPGNVMVSESGVLTVPAGLTASTYDVVVDLAAATTGGITDANVVLWQATPLFPTMPDLYVPFVDPKYGTTMRVINTMSQIAAASGGELALARTAPEYSQIQMWNADMTMFLVATGYGYYVCDYLNGGAIITKLYNYQPDWRNFKWHPTRPNEIIAFGNEANRASVIWPTGWTKHQEMVVAKLIIDKVAKTYQAYVTCSLGGTGPERATMQAYKTAGKDQSNTGSWSMLNEEGAIDPVTGDYWAALAGQTTADYNAGQNNNIWLFSVNTDKNQVSAEITTLSINPNWYSGAVNTSEALRAVRVPDRWFMTPNAQYYCGAFNGTTQPESYTSLAGLQFFHRDTMAFAFAYRFSSTGHSDTLLDENGVPWIVKCEIVNSYYPPGFTGHGVYALRIDGVTEYKKLLQPPAVVAGASHVSGRHASRPHGSAGKAFACLSFYNEHDMSIPVSLGDIGGMNDGNLKTTPPGPFAHECVLIWLDSTPTVPHIMRLCNTQSAADQYWGGQPHAVVSPDATKVGFATNWKDWLFEWNFPYRGNDSHVAEVAIPASVTGSY